MTAWPSSNVELGQGRSGPDHTASVDEVKLDANVAVIFLGDVVETIPITAGIDPNRIKWEKDGAEMVLIPAGSFEMGDHLDEMGNALPVHSVELDSFYMDVHEVTVGQFKEFIDETGYNYEMWDEVANVSPGDRYPMVFVSWDDATAYAKWANKRLPTEAEWEYAARGKLTGKRYPWGDEISHDNANYSGTGGKDKWGYCSPVGSFEANGYGLYDMAGNVREWCADWYGEDYYSESPAKNPPGPGTGSRRVLRGGSWDDLTYNLRVAYRAPFPGLIGCGFRCVSVSSNSGSFTIISNLEIPLVSGWNMISMPGQPLQTDPASLRTADNSLILPLYRWNPTTFSYEAVTELKFAEGYWALTINAEGTTLEIAVNSANSYDRTLQPGWNMIGGVSQPADFTNPQDDPDNSIIAGTLYNWNPTNFSYEAQTEILPDKGYWVLTLAECQLTVGGDTAIPTAPQKLPQPEVMISLNLSCEEWHRNLEIGLDQSATKRLDKMDRALPPSGPIEIEHQVYLVGDSYRLRRDVRPVSEQEISWQICISSPDQVQLTVDRQQISGGQELVIIDGRVETVLIAGVGMQLESGDRELTVSLRPLPQETQLLQNYPNPFNPETWIPYQLNQASEVSLSVYSSEGKLVREIDLGLKPAGNYQTTARAIYWDGRNPNGEPVSSGVYFYRLQAGDYSQTRKMVILK